MTWENPLVNWRMVSTVGSEVTPFVFRKRLYRVENFKRAEDFPGRELTYRFHEDGFRIRDVDEDRIISIPLLNHYFASAFVWKDRIYIYCADYGDIKQEWWKVKQLVMISSDNLISWTAPIPVVKAEGEEHLFNNSVCHDGKRFVLLFETDDARWTPFTFRFCVSDDLVHWQRLPEKYIYGTDKYVGGPALYFEGGFYYVAYVAAKDGFYETLLARSRDLICWEEAPAGRPLVTWNAARPGPAFNPTSFERNASDVDMCEWQNKVLVYWNGGDQRTWGDLQSAEFHGTRRELLESFFRG